MSRRKVDINLFRRHLVLYWYIQYGIGIYGPKKNTVIYTQSIINEWWAYMLTQQHPWYTKSHSTHVPNVTSIIQLRKANIIYFKKPLSCRSACLRKAAGNFLYFFPLWPAVYTHSGVFSRPIFASAHIQLYASQCICSVNSVFSNIWLSGSVSLQDHLYLCVMRFCASWRPHSTHSYYCLLFVQRAQET